MLGSHRGDDIHRLGRRNLVASDSSPKARRQSISTNCAHSVLNLSSSTGSFISTGDISNAVLVKWESMAIKKKIIRKALFHVILKRLEKKQTEN